MISIKKHVSLDFLGDDYKEAFIKFRALPVSQFGEIQKEIEAIKETDSVTYILDRLKQNFIEGKLPDDNGKLVDLAVEDLEQFDIETVLKCWQTYTGQVPDPKD